MTLARIIASLSEEASRLAEHLNDLGFDVELVSPDEVPSAPADVELRVEAFSVPAAFERAAQVAGSSDAIYVSAELLNPVEEAVPVPQTPAVEAPRMEPAPVQPVIEVEPAFEYEEIEEDEELEPEFEASITKPQIAAVAERFPEPVAATPPAPLEVAQPVRSSVEHKPEVEPRPNRVAEGVVTLGESVLAAGDAIGRGLSRAGSDLRWLGRRIGTAAVETTQSARSAWRSHAEARATRRVEKERARQDLARRQEELRVELERKRQDIQAKRLEEDRLRLARQEQRRLEQEEQQAARAAQETELRRQAEERERAEQAAREAMLQRMAAERAAREQESQRAPESPSLPTAVPSTPAVQLEPPVSRAVANAHAVAGGMLRARRPVRAHMRPAPPLSRRDQDWRRAFSLAAGLSLGLVVGWIALAGRRPANPIPLQNLVQSPSVQQPVPFGPATIAPSPRKPSPRIPAASKPAPRPQVKPALRRTRKASSGQDEELPDDVVVRHFGAKVQDAKAAAPVTQANTAKEQNGVKVFSDDQ